MVPLRLTMRPAQPVPICQVSPVRPLRKVSAGGRRRSLRVVLGVAVDVCRRVRRRAEVKKVALAGSSNHGLPFLDPEPVEACEACPP